LPHHGNGLDGAIDGQLRRAHEAGRRRDGNRSGLSAGKIHDLARRQGNLGAATVADGEIFRGIRGDLDRVIAERHANWLSFRLYFNGLIGYVVPGHAGFRLKAGHEEGEIRGIPGVID